MMLAAGGGLMMGLLLLLAAALFYSASRRPQTKRLRELAKSRRLNYAPEDLLDLQQRYHSLELMRRGHSRHACHLIYGSTEAGLITLFFHAFDLGFGAHRQRQQFWTAVLETPFLNDTWSARLDESGQAGGSSSSIHAGDAALSRLRACDVEAMVLAAPPEIAWEARGFLLAVSTVVTRDAAVPGELLRLLADAASRLRTLAPASEQGWRSDMDAGRTGVLSPEVNPTPEKSPTPEP